MGRTQKFITVDRKWKGGGRSTGRGQGQDSLKVPTPDKSFLLRFSESSKIVPPARDRVFKTSSCEGHLTVKPELVLFTCIVIFLKRQLHLWLDFSSSDVYIVLYLLYILKVHWVENYDHIKPCILTSEYFYPQTGRQPWYPSAGEWLNKLLYIQTVAIIQHWNKIRYKNKKKNRKELECVLLSKGGHSKKYT